MTFIVLNKENPFSPNFGVEYNTFLEAEAAAESFLNSNPKAQLSVAEVQKNYTAAVVITKADPVPVTPPQEDPVE